MGETRTVPFDHGNPLHRGSWHHLLVGRQLTEAAEMAVALSDPRLADDLSPDLRAAEIIELAQHEINEAKRLAEQAIRA